MGCPLWTSMGAQLHLPQHLPPSAKPSTLTWNGTPNMRDKTKTSALWMI
jgi:hypothetical protein